MENKGCPWSCLVGGKANSRRITAPGSSPEGWGFEAQVEKEELEYSIHAVEYHSAFKRQEV